MQQCDLKKKKTKRFDWDKVEEIIRDLWERGLSPRSISRKLADDGLGDYPATNVNAFVGKFRRSESSNVRRKNLGGLIRARQEFGSTFVCAICKLTAHRSTWNSRFCVTCRKNYSDRQLNRFKVYGILPSEFDSMIERQGDCCVLCSVKFDHSNSTAGLANPCVDHDHATGNVRGILCMKCNWALHMAESSEWRDKVKVYLRQEKAAGLI